MHAIHWSFFVCDYGGPRICDAVSIYDVKFINDIFILSYQCFCSALALAISINLNYTVINTKVNNNKSIIFFHHAQPQARSPSFQKRGGTNAINETNNKCMTAELTSYNLNINSVRNKFDDFIIYYLLFRLTSAFTQPQ